MHLQEALRRFQKNSLHEDYEVIRKKPLKSGRGCIVVVAYFLAVPIFEAASSVHFV